MSVEVDMLRTQAVAVGDVDDILQQLDKQKVRTHTLYQFTSPCAAMPVLDIFVPVPGVSVASR